jgi:peroxiredoxin Q/BCP
MAAQLGKGDPIPPFSVLDQDRKTWTRDDVLGEGPVIIYFYPKDETPVCTAEACHFRDDFAAFTDVGARVFGVSADSPESHATFAANHRLPFRLLADEGNAMKAAFGVKAAMGIFPGRVTFVVDAAGVVQHAFSAQLHAKKHVDEALRVLRTLK